MLISFFSKKLRANFMIDVYFRASYLFSWKHGASKIFAWYEDDWWCLWAEQPGQRLWQLVVHLCRGWCHGRKCFCPCLWLDYNQRTRVMKRILEMALRYYKYIYLGQLPRRQKFPHEPQRKTFICTGLWQKGEKGVGRAWECQHSNRLGNKNRKKEKGMEEN